MTKEYLVLVTANDKGEDTGLRVREDPRVGRVGRLFSSKEKLDEYVKRSDENQHFIDIMERLPEHYGSEDLQDIGYHRKTTVRELSPTLEASR